MYYPHRLVELLKEVDVKDRLKRNYIESGYYTFNEVTGYVTLVNSNRPDIPVLHSLSVRQFPSFCGGILLGDVSFAAASAADSDQKQIYDLILRWAKESGYTSVLAVIPEHHVWSIKLLKETGFVELGEAFKNKRSGHIVQYYQLML